MKTFIVNIPEKQEDFFLSLLKERRLKSRVLTEEEKEDFGLLSMMMERADEKTVPVKTTHDILDKIIKKK